MKLDPSQIGNETAPLGATSYIKVITYKFNIFSFIEANKSKITVLIVATLTRAAKFR